jgi:hypothetical protein
MIQKKKESSERLINNKITPKSLRTKCELSAAPSYTNHKAFIRLKQNFQDDVSNFIKNSTLIMKEWSIINLELLYHDRCNNILQKTLNILEGLMQFYFEVINPTPWTSIPQPQLPLLLIKIYFDSNLILDIQEIITYFNIPKDKILLICAKIITGHHQGDDLANKSLEAINISLLKKLNDSQTIFINKMLTNFHIIMKSTTVELWEDNLQKLRIAKATQKFKLKLETSNLRSATTATSNAIDKATESINLQNLADAATQLRIANLDKLLLQQQQTINHLIKFVKKLERKPSWADGLSYSHAKSNSRRNSRFIIQPT